MEDFSVLNVGHRHLFMGAAAVHGPERDAVRFQKNYQFTIQIFRLTLWQNCMKKIRKPTRLG
jgi:hypothetical protein